MKTRLKFDPNNFFMEGMHTDESKTRFMKSAVFYLAVAAYNCGGSNIRIGRIAYDSQNSHIVRADLMTPAGFSIGNIHGSFSEYTLALTQSPIRSDCSGYGAITTSNPRYFMNKVSSKSEHDAAISLRNSASRTTNKIVSDALHSLLDNLILSFTSDSGRFRSRRPDIHLDSSVVNTIARVFAGDLDRSSLSISFLNDFQIKYSEYLGKVNKFSSSVDQIEEFVSQDKWVMFTDINHGMIVGAVSSKPLLDAIKEYRVEGSLPTNSNFTYCHEVVPFKWYESFDSIPSDIRSELELSLLMLKTHTNSNNLIPNADFSHALEMGAAMNTYYSDTPVLALHK